MKKALIVNAYLLMMSWCLYLNGLLIVPVILILSGTAMLLMKIGEVSYWRIAALCISSYMIFLSVFYASNIPYFFPDLRILMIFVSFNAIIVSESLKQETDLPLGRLSALVTVTFAVLSLLIAFLPEEEYSLFSKASVFMMAAFIFLPFLLPLLLNLLGRTIRSLKIDKGSLKELKKVISR